MLLVAALLANLGLGCLVADLASGGRGFLASLSGKLWIPGGALALLAGLAFGSYILHPWRIRWRHKPHPLSPEQAPEAVKYLSGWASRLKVPWLRIEYKEGFGEGHAYGFRGREALILHGFPQILERSWDDYYKAIALHELAHVVNGDAAEREKASAVWKGSLLSMGFLLVVYAMTQLQEAVRAVPESWGLPGMLLFLFLGSMLLGWTFAGQLLVLRFIYRRLVRRREFDADWLVVSWRVGAALDRLLKAQERRPEPRLRSLWSLHPSPRERRKVIADPGSLSRISLRLAFVTGILLTIVLSGSLFPLVGLLQAFLTLTTSLAAGIKGSESAFLLALERSAIHLLALGLFLSVFFYAVSYFTMATLGVQAQREALTDLVEEIPRNAGYLRLALPALLLSVGMEVGLFLAPFSPFPTLATRLTLLPFWLLGFTLLMWLWLAYIRAATRLSLGGHLGSTFPQGRQSFVLHSATLLLTVLYWPIAIFRIALFFRPEMFPSYGGLDPSGVYSLVLASMPTGLAVFACGIFGVWSGIGLVTAALALRARRSCLHCQAPVSSGFTIGRRCKACGKSLSPWMYVDRDDGPGNPRMEKTSLRQERLLLPKGDGLDAGKREMWLEIAMLSLFLTGFLFVVAAGFRFWMIFVPWDASGEAALRHYEVEAIGEVALPGIAFIVGAWALRFFLDGRWAEKPQSSP